MEDALSVYSRLVNELKPPSSHALAALGRIYYEQGKFELARRFLANALQSMTGEPKPLDGDGGVKESFALSLDRPAVQRLLDQIAAKQSIEEGQNVSVTPDGPLRKGNDGNVRPARPVLDTPIEYPEHARRAGVEGIVVLSLLIDEMGQLMRCEVTSGHKDLAQALLKAVQRWRFEPQLVNGRPEASRLSLTIEFKLSESPRFR